MLTPQECQQLHIITEDGVTVHKGDRVYNYYDMEPGVIGDIGYPYHQGEDETMNHKRDVWFDHNADNGKRSILNGERICTMEYARRRGFKGA